MVNSLSHFTSATVLGTDGSIGRVDTVLFDRLSWTIRYLVVDTQAWLSGRRVLVTPASVVRVGRVDGGLLLSLTRAEVQSSPAIDLAAGLTAQDERRLLRHYGQPEYVSRTVWAPSTLNPYDVADVQLCSSAELVGFAVLALDGEVGTLSDLFFDKPSWSIRYLLVVSASAPLGRGTLLSPLLIEHIDLEARQVRVSMTAAEFACSPEYPLPAP